MRNHCVLWIDYEKAHIAFIDGDAPTSVDIAIGHAHEHGNIHHQAGSIGPGKSTLDSAFIVEIERQLAQCRKFVIVGPGTAKLEFIRYIHRNAPGIEEKMAGVETLGDVTEPQLIDFACSYFRKFDQIHASNDEVLDGLAAHRP
jgi:hypothetical protein